MGVFMGSLVPGKGNPGDGRGYLVRDGDARPTVNVGYLPGKNRSKTPWLFSGTM